GRSSRQRRLQSNTPLLPGKSLMRGPGLRLTNDVRRLWRCPRCGYERRAPATEVAISCKCSQPNPRMQLVEPIRKVRDRQPALPVYVECDKLLPEETPVETAEHDVSEAGLAPSAAVETKVTLSADKTDS